MKFLFFLVLVLMSVEAKNNLERDEYKTMVDSCIKQHNGNSCISVGFLSQVSNLNYTDYQKIRLKYNWFEILPLGTMDKFYNFSKKIKIDNNHNRALYMYEKACAYHNAIGCTLSGLHAKSDKRREAFYLTSCYNLKNANGCYMLGSYYESLNNFKQAKNFYRMGCNMQNAISCTQLGSIYAFREKKEKIGFKLHKLGCELSQVYKSRECLIAYPLRMNVKNK